MDDDDQHTGVSEAHHTGDDRDKTATDRDQQAEAFDRTAESRDKKAADRDDRSEKRERDSGRYDSGAASDRGAARRERQGAAGDRSHASDDREAAADDRHASARERTVAGIDELTGARRRDTGLIELEREVSRAHRTTEPFTLAFIDVDSLKKTNDSLGHAAGDQLLRQIVDTMRKHLRPYDLIIRYGGDEFLVGLQNLDTKGATERFVLINADLERVEHASVSLGFAELKASESLEALIGRADKALYKGRQVDSRSSGK